MKRKSAYTFGAKIWLYPSETATWHFVTLPKNESANIRHDHALQRRGFGSLPVTVTINKTTWNTSIFPDNHSGCYLLPLKASIRKKEELLLDDTITISLTIRIA